MQNIYLPRKIASCFLLIVACLVVVLLPAHSAPAAAPSAPGYAQAVSDFQGKRYARALSGFQAAVRAKPNDAMCHYYMALCYQYQNQVGFALQEYQWVVANCRDARLKAQAQAGLSQMEHYSSSRLTQLSSASRFSAGAAGRAGSGAAGASGGGSAGGAAAGNFARGRLKVMVFSTKWCGVCKRYDPNFDQVASISKYSATCDFQHLDAEEPGNADLVRRYSIAAYPTTVCADSTGKPIQHFTGLTSAEGLASIVDQSLSRVPK